MKKLFYLVSIWILFLVFTVTVQAQTTLVVSTPNTVLSGLNLDGAIPLTPWTANANGTWTYFGWTTQFKPTTDTRGIDPKFPLTKYPDQVFYNGRLLLNVCAPDGSMVVPSSGDFCVNYAAQTITIADDPTSAVVKTSAWPLAIIFAPGSDGSSLVNSLVIDYAPHYDADQHGAILIEAPNITLNNVTCSNSSVRCVNAQVVAGLKITNSNFSNNGEGGIAGANLTGALISGNIFNYNNVACHYLDDWDAAGAKFSRGTGNTIVGNTASHNCGPGIWFDYLWTGLSVQGNTTQFNQGHGIDLEKGQGGDIGGNISTDNNIPIADSQTACISAAGDSNLTIHDNTLANCFTDLKIVDSTASGVPLSTGNKLSHNSMTGGVAGDFDLLYVHNYSPSTGNTAAKMVVSSDFNNFCQVGGIPPYVIGWDKTPVTPAGPYGVPTQYPTLAAFQADVPVYEANSVTCAIPPSPTPTPSVTPTPTPSPSPTGTPTPLPTVTPSPTPTSTPIPTVTPTPGPVPVAFISPTDGGTYVLHYPPPIKVKNALSGHGHDDYFDNGVKLGSNRSKYFHWQPTSAGYHILQVNDIADSGAVVGTAQVSVTLQ